MKITIRGLYGQYGKNPIFEETIDADTAEVPALAKSYAQREGITMLEFEVPDEPDESKRFFRFGIWGEGVITPLDEHEYLGTPEDLDALGIPREHTVISPGFGHRSKPSLAGPEKSEREAKDDGYR
jgi:hypothetical protein